MDRIADKTIQEKIEILTLIEQQLAVRTRLRSLLKPASGSIGTRSTHGLEDAIVDVAPGFWPGTMSDSRRLHEQAEAVRSKLDDLKKTQDGMADLKGQCEKLTKAVEMAREYISQTQGPDNPKKRARTLADLDNLSEAASATVKVCKKLKTQHDNDIPRKKSRILNV